MINLRKFKVLLQTPKNVEEFYDFCSKFSYDINLKREGFKCEIDAKSLLGLVHVASQRTPIVVMPITDNVEDFVSKISNFEWYKGEV